MPALLSTSLASSLAIAAVLLPAGAFAQQLAPGARVRATVAEAPDRPAGPFRQVTGRLVRLGTDTVLVAQGDRVVAVPRHGLIRLETPGGSVSRGRSALRGAGMGAAIGFIGGAVLSYAAYEPCEGEFLCFSRESEAVMGGVVAGALGLAIGGVIGAARGRERWQRVPIDADTRVGVVATPRTVALSLRF